MASWQSHTVNTETDASLSHNGKQFRDFPRMFKQTAHELKFQLQLKCDYVSQAKPTF